MKNQYFGDVKDYLKYGILRQIARGGLTLGVCWMLSADDSSKDGRMTRYLLNPEDWRHHDPELFDGLYDSVLRKGLRSVSAVENLIRAKYVRSYVPAGPRERSEWLHAEVIARQPDIWFFDPDNGIEVPSVAGRKRSTKHVYWDELEAAWRSGASLVVFQHFARENREAHAERLTAELERRLPDTHVSLLWTAAVLYIVAAQPRHRAVLSEATRAISVRWAPRIIERSTVERTPHRLTSRPAPTRAGRSLPQRLAAALRALFGD